MNKCSSCGLKSKIYYVIDGKKLCYDCYKKLEESRKIKKDHN